jgi:hypothetical protein
MWYQLKVDILVAALVLSGAGLVILTLWVWIEVRDLFAARHRIYAHLSRLTLDPRFFTNPLAISRGVSRTRQAGGTILHSHQ